MSYEIEPARPEDEAALEAMFCAYYDELTNFGMTYELNREKLAEVLRARIRSRMFFFPVARAADGAVAGFLMGSVNRIGAEYLSCGAPAVGFLHEMYVAPEHRGQGVAKSLLHALEDWLRAQSVPTLELHVLPGNRGAYALYEAEGFSTAASILYKKLN